MTDDAALIAGQFSCPHDLSERETACADGYCRQAHDVQNGMLRDLQAANAKLAEQAEEIAHGDKAIGLDAERYRWLRDEHSDLSFMFALVKGRPLGIMARDKLDAAIDSAIAASAKGKP